METLKAPAASRGTVALLFHRVADQPDAFETVTRDFFERCLQMISRRSMIGVALDRVAVSPLPAVALTFDDGWESDYTAVVPLLVRYGMTGTFFVTVGHLDQPGFVTVSWVREMADLGMEIGSHAVSHRYLTRLDGDDVRHELSASKRRLEDLLGKRVSSFAIPGGEYNGDIVNAAFQAGYARLATSVPGVNRVGAVVLKRCSIHSRTSIAEAERIVGRSFSSMARLRFSHMMRSAVKTAIGIENYARLRGYVLRR